jgi:hypothetical protein
MTGAGIVQVGAGADGRCALGCQWAVAAKHPGRNGARNDCWPSGSPILFSPPSSPLIHALHCLTVNLSSFGKPLTMPPTVMHEKGDAVQPDTAAGGLHDASQSLPRTCSRSVPGQCALTHPPTICASAAVSSAATPRQGRHAGTLTLRSLDVWMCCLFRDAGSRSWSAVFRAAVL